MHGGWHRDLVAEQHRNGRPGWRSQHGPRVLAVVAEHQVLPAVDLAPHDRRGELDLIAVCQVHQLTWTRHGKIRHIGAMRRDEGLDARRRRLQSRHHRHVGVHRRHAPRQRIPGRGHALHHVLLMRHLLLWRSRFRGLALLRNSRASAAHDQQGHERPKRRGGAASIAVRSAWLELERAVSRHRMHASRPRHTASNDRPAPTRSRLVIRLQRDHHQELVPGGLATDGAARIQPSKSFDLVQRGGRQPRDVHACGLRVESLQLQVHVVDVLPR